MSKSSFATQVCNLDQAWPAVRRATRVRPHTLAASARDDSHHDARSCRLPLLVGLAALLGANASVAASAGSAGSSTHARPTRPSRHRCSAGTAPAALLDDGAQATEPPAEPADAAVSASTAALAERALAMGRSAAD